MCDRIDAGVMQAAGHSSPPSDKSYIAGMTDAELPTTDDFLACLASIRDDAAERAKRDAKALVTSHAAKGRLHSGATLKALATVIENEFGKALEETFNVLHRMRAVPGASYASFRDQAIDGVHELLKALRVATDLDKWLDMIGWGSAAEAINVRLDALPGKVDYRFRQFDVGLDRFGPQKGGAITPTATRLQQRLNDRRTWFQNEWFFKWHHIGGERTVEIDQFNGAMTSYAGISFSGSARDIYWHSIVTGVRKEIVDQLSWVEEAVRGYDQGVAVKAIDEGAGLLIGFARGIRREAIEKDRILRGNGLEFPAEQDLGHWDGGDEAAIHAQAEALKAAMFPADKSAPVAGARATPAARVARESKAFQVALSFAGEQRDYVINVAKALVARHIAVFYDEFQANALWGKDGAEHFHQVYANDAQYVVMFISAEYVAKSWTRHERRLAISRQMKDDAEYILPVRFDDAEVPGLPDTLQYLNADRYTPAQLAVEIARKIGLSPTAGKASDVPPPASSAGSGEVTFDYAAHNGRYVLGTGATLFETAWSKASDTSIHLMNDPPSINGIAVARGASEIDQVADAASFDFSSRTRTVKTGEVAVLRNIEGFYAAVKVTKVEDDSRGGDSDALTISYIILTDGGANFSGAATTSAV